MSNSSELSLAFAVLFTALTVSPAVAQTPAQRPEHALPAPQPDQTLDLRIPSAVDGVALATTVYLPAGSGPFPVIIVAHGANAASRNRPGWRTHLGAIIDAGIAIAVADPRGTGDTPGEWVEGGPLDAAAQDISAIADHLAAHPRIRHDRIGIWGASRGGWTGPMAAAGNPRIRFVAVVSAPSVSPNAQNIHQRGQELTDEGYSTEDVDEINAFRRVVWDYYGTGQNYEAAREVWRTASKRPWFSRIGLTRPEPIPPDQIMTPSFQYYREGAYNPMPVLSALRTPILVILGGGDRHIPVDACYSGWRAAFAASGNPDATIVMFNRAGHAMRIYDGLEPMSAVHGHGALAAGVPHPGYMPTLVAWLRRQVND
ncbi:MAG: prolyl oligopeptidase family serine peptidase [Flavobacteriales bacterium]|nr:prolyl oligopeptidase family serine peptidase [Flavobacteriales bacterium]MBP6697106.1 prolyl oligopeptidase family serine peptidase [Flavobacteriales bacterium]